MYIYIYIYIVYYIVSYYAMLCCYIMLESIMTYVILLDVCGHLLCYVMLYTCMYMYVYAVVNTMLCYVAIAG